MKENIMAIVKQKIVILHPGFYKGVRESKLQKSPHPKFRKNTRSNSLNHNIDISIPSDVHIFWECYENDLLVRLIVMLVGNTTVPDLHEYSKSVKEIEFAGHVCCIRTALKMVSQLKVCESVKFFLSNPDQLPFLDNDNPEEPLEPNTTITSLNIFMELESKPSKTKEMIEILNFQLKSLFENAVKALPKVSRLEVALPATGRYFDLLKNHLEKWEHLKMKYVSEIRNEKVVVGYHPNYRRPTANPPPPKAISQVQQPEVKDIQPSQSLGKDKRNSQPHEQRKEMLQQKTSAANISSKRKSNDNNSDQPKQKKLIEDPKNKNRRLSSNSSDPIQDINLHPHPACFNNDNDPHNKKESRSDTISIEDIEKALNMIHQHQFNENPFTRAFENPADVKPFQLDSNGEIKFETQFEGHPRFSDFNGGQSNIHDHPAITAKGYRRHHSRWNLSTAEVANEVPPHTNFGSGSDIHSQKNFSNTYPNANNIDPSLYDTSMMSTDEEDEEDRTSSHTIAPDQFQNMFERRRPRPHENALPHSDLTSASSNGLIRLDKMFKEKETKNSSN